MDLLAIFLTGLLTGGLTCLAVQGGLLAATLSQGLGVSGQGLEKNKEAFPILAFLGAKLVAYTMLGLFLGFLGSVFQLSVTTQALLQVIVAIFMVGTALNLLNIHPIFRYFILQPPRFLTRIIHNQSKSKDIFAPAILGAFTVFIPCGTTQAMMALAIASGSPLSGALILFTFILGTSPIFFILGYLATKLGEILHQKFMRLAAIAIILLAVFNLNNALNILGINAKVRQVLASVYCTVSFCRDDPGLVHGAATDAVDIEFTASGYKTAQTAVRAGSQVTLNLKNSSGRGCIQAFTIPSLGIRKIVRVGTSQKVTINIPDRPGVLSFMCSMGMFQGKLNII